MPVAGVAAGAAILGGAAGSQKDVSNTSSNMSQTSTMQVAPAGAQETAAKDTAFNSIGSLDERLKQLESSPVLSNLDKLMQELGQAPSADRIAQSNSFANNVFAPQQTALNQSFEDQTRAFSNRAAQMGRSGSDPILAAKLAQEQVRQQAQLSAEKGSFAAQESINAPQRQFSNQLSALGGLSQQAIQNRQAVFSLGSQFANSEMNFRLASAGRTTTGTNNTEQSSGGGFKGLVTGALGGAGAGASMGNSIFPAGGNNPFSSGFVARGVGVH